MKELKDKHNHVEEVVEEEAWAVVQGIHHRCIDYPAKQTEELFFAQYYNNYEYHYNMQTFIMEDRDHPHK